jgi:hypothetical protein
MTALSLCPIIKSPMEIQTDYALKIFFPSPAFTQIYYEAVANALDANATEVSIHILTDDQITQKQLEITITDNGEGFTEERFERFKVTQESDAYHKGLGRLIYLRYFKEINVESVFERERRTFTYSKTFRGKDTVDDADPADKHGTVLRFSGFLNERLRSFDDVRPIPLKAKIIEHFLPTFDGRKNAKRDFTIRIELQVIGSGSNEVLFPDVQTITLADIPEFESKTIQDDSLSSDITMRYMLEQDSGHRTYLTAVSIDGRTIPIKLLEPGALPLTSSAIFLFESELFGQSDTARQKWTAPEGVNEKELTRVLQRAVSSVLSENFKEIERKNTSTKKFFEERYPHLTGYFDQVTVGIINKDDALWSAEKRFFHEQRQVLECNTLDDAMFEKSLEVSSRTLTEYILYRELIIQKLREISESDTEYSIHNLIVPRFKEYQDHELVDGIYRNNAWVLDDKFMSFRTILSEYSMETLIKKISTTEETIEADGRPDISMIFSGDPNGNEKVEVVVIELKRQGDDVKENAYVLYQLLERARKLADYCPNIERVWYFGIIQINEGLARILKDSKWAPLFSKGQVFYQDFPVTRSDGSIVPTPIYLLSYETIIKDATARNHTFLEILKSEIRKVQVQSNGHDQLRLDGEEISQPPDAV